MGDQVSFFPGQAFSLLRYSFNSALALTYLRLCIGATVSDRSIDRLVSKLIYLSLPSSAALHGILCGKYGTIERCCYFLCNVLTALRRRFMFRLKKKWRRWLCFAFAVVRSATTRTRSVEFRLHVVLRIEPCKN